MREICEDLKAHSIEVLAEWERLVREEPWYSLPAEHRIDSLPEVVVGLVEASLCRPQDWDACRQKILAAAAHGQNRRERGIPEWMMFTEYHLLRRAIWTYLVSRWGASDKIVDAIMRIDTAITGATNASMWGYYRVEVEALGKWEEGMDRLIASSPLLGRAEQPPRGEREKS
jgi:hypothetical protein